MGNAGSIICVHGRQIDTLRGSVTMSERVAKLFPRIGMATSIQDGDCSECGATDIIRVSGFGQNAKRICPECGHDNPDS